MDVPATIFRQYDIRGTVGDQLTPALARAVGAAFATLAHERLGRAPRIAAGPGQPTLGARAGRRRRPGDRGRRAAASSTSAMLPTPALYFATHVLAVDGGLQVTGSHNPPEFNGFKMVLAGEAMYGDDIQRAATS